MSAAPPFAELGITVFERGWLSSNNVLLAAPGAQETVLIDTGYASHAEQTVALVRNALQGQALGRIINTHLHSDHCGGNFALHQAFACAIDVPLGEAAKVDRWDEGALSYAATGQHCPRFVRSGVISPGDHVRHGAMSWEVLAAPGHDPESVVLYERDHQLLISADALWSHGFGVVFPELVGEPGFGEVESTLNMIASLPIRWVIPGHGSPFSDVDAALERAFQRLRGLAADPAKHARHAAKVLIKFHMLEVQSCSRSELARWLEKVPFLSISHRLHFADKTAHGWLSEMVKELIASGALEAVGDRISNI